ncbi:hypothetical protein [Caballeronia arationis]|uniref:hypothetical protein n=1 Tax=Caballeronia arationis TaxID=1777142 RepID=UPI00141F6A9B
MTFGYSRGDPKLADLATAGGNAKAGAPWQAVEHAEPVLLAAHWLGRDDVLAQAGDLRGKTVLTCTMPLDASSSERVVVHTDSGAESIARPTLFPCRRLVPGHAQPTAVRRFQCTGFVAASQHPVVRGRHSEQGTRRRASCSNWVRPGGCRSPGDRPPHRALRNARYRAGLWARGKAERVYHFGRLK